MVLFLLASGLTLIFGLLKIINFAHGALYMLGAYLAYQISVMVGFWWALAGVPLGLALVWFIGAICGGFLAFQFGSYARHWIRQISIR